MCETRSEAQCPSDDDHPPFGDVPKQCGLASMSERQVVQGPRQDKNPDRDNGSDVDKPSRRGCTTMRWDACCSAGVRSVCQMCSRTARCMKDSRKRRATSAVLNHHPRLACKSSHLSAERMPARAHRARASVSRCRRPNPPSRSSADALRGPGVRSADPRLATRRSHR